MILSSCLSLLVIILVALFILYGLFPFPLKLLDYFKKDKTQSQNKKFFPIVITIIYTISPLIVFWFIVPQFKKIFNELGPMLPLPTKVYLYISDFLCKFWYVVPFVLLALIFFGIRTKIDARLKILFYSFIRFVCVIIILGGLIALFLPLLSDMKAIK
jgi:type II secretory pathway component PulF